jgi:hypothetical protein
VTAGEERCLERATATVRLLSNQIRDYEVVCPKPWLERLLDWIFRRLH